MPRISKEREAAVRDRILEAGITVFEERGFAGASMAAIADRARLSAGNIYTYYASKEELFLSAFAALVADEEHALEEAIKESPNALAAVDLVVDYITGLATGAAGDFRGAGANFLLHAWATADGNPDLRDMLLGRRTAAAGIARTVIEGAITRDELPQDTDADGLGLAFTSVLDGLFLQRAERGGSLDREDARRQVYAMVDAIFSRPSR